jgi:hypothetical protein
MYGGSQASEVAADSEELKSMHSSRSRPLSQSSLLSSLSYSQSKSPGRGTPPAVISPGAHPQHNVALVAAATFASMRIPIFNGLWTSTEQTLERTWNTLLTDEGELNMGQDWQAIEDLCRDMERAAELIQELATIVAKYSN